MTDANMSTDNAQDGTEEKSGDSINDSMRNTQGLPRNMHVAVKRRTRIGTMEAKVDQKPSEQACLRHSCRARTVVVVL
jgi:hypothetical protein